MALPLHFFHPFSSEEANHRFVSSLFSVLTSCLLWVSTQEAALFYWWFLFIDTFKPRHTPISSEVLLHHLIAASLVVVTLCSNLLFLPVEIPIVDAITYNLLLLERTTPILHASWILKHIHYTKLAIVSFALLMILWVPWRLIPSFTSMVLVLDITSTYWVLAFVYGLSAMQFYWFFRICVTFINALRARGQETNGKDEIDQKNR